MRNGYYQIGIAPKDIYKTAFVTPRGHFKLVGMSFGLTTAPRTFQRAVTNIFEDQKNVLVFIDDLLVYDTEVRNHINSLKLVFDKLSQNKVLLNLNKCEFFLNRIKYLGRIIEYNSTSPDLTEVRLKKSICPLKTKES